MFRTDLTRSGAQRLLGARWLPLLLAALFCAQRLLELKGSPVWGTLDLDLGPLSRGSFLWAGLPLEGFFSNMPLFQTAASLAFNFGPGPNGFFCLLYCAALLLVFSAGRLAAGRGAGLAALVFAGLLRGAGRPGYNFEQLFYAGLLLLALNALLLLRRDGGLRSLALCGLAAGASLLARTPLFAFAVPVMFCDWYYGRHRPAVLLRRCALFLACSYVLLLPWAWAKYRVSGELALLDGRRGACNVLTAARGGIFSMKNDCHRALRLPEDADPLAFYLRESVAHPLRWAVGTLRRLWRIMLFYPLPMAAFAAALVFCRRERRLYLFALPLYYLAVHALLAVEMGYFYPLIFMLPPVAAAALPLRGAEEGPGLSLKIPAAALALLVLVVQGLALAYPARSANVSLNLELAETLARRYPADKSFKRLSCDLRRGGDAEVFLACQREYGDKFSDPVVAWHAAVLAAASPSGLRPPPNTGEKIEYPMIVFLRETELGDRPSARAAYARAWSVYEGWHARLSGLLPGEKPSPVSLAAPAGLELPLDIFWSKHVLEALQLWPAARAAGLVAALGKDYPQASLLTAHYTPPAPAARPAAVKPLPPAPARRAGPDFAELSASCLALSRAGEPERALRDCQAALYLAEAGGADALQAAAVARETAALLKRQGREAEAAALAGWSGVPR